MEQELLGVCSKRDHGTGERRVEASIRRPGRGVVVAVLLFSASGLACSSLLPVRSFRAARYYAEGTRALDRGDAEVAIAELEQAAALMPTASEIQNHLGLAYWSDGREVAALRALERAVELDCDNEAARANLASLHRARGAKSAIDAAISDGEGGGVAAQRSDSDGG